MSLILCGGIGSVNASPASVTGLRCEYLANPLGVDAVQPRLSWIDTADGRGWKQSAYRVRVASRPDLLAAGRADLWDSGKIASDQTTNIRYAGKALVSGDRCFWAAQVWDSSGRPSSMSAAGSWQMGLLKPSDWKAQWISAQTPCDVSVDGLILPPCPYLRQTFTLPKPVKSAMLYATARGVYELHLNGAKVGDAVLAPGWTDYRKRIQYQAYDVTAQVHPGANAIGAILGDGWYAGYVGFAHKRNHYGTVPALRLQINVTYADGSRQTVSTNQTWQGTVGAITYSDLLMGEAYDARKSPIGWDRADFHAASWPPAVTAPDAGETNRVDVTSLLRAKVASNALTVVADNALAGDPALNQVKALRVDYTLGGATHSQAVAEGQTLQIPGVGEPSGPLIIQRAVYGALNAPAQSSQPLLVASHGPPVRVTQDMTPKKITQPAPGTYIFDLGQNMVGWARLRVQGVAGTAVKLRFGEILNPDGSLYTANLRSARATDTYICRGRGVETWEPHFTFHGFRYVEVTGYPGAPGIDAITGRVVGSDIPPTGTFTCSSPMVNQLQRNIVWSQRGNFLSIPTDCPQRDERLGWMGDAQIFVRTATLNRDVAAFYEKWMQDVDDAQAPDGGFSDVSPRLVDQSDGAPAWADAGIIVPWTVYQTYGDTAILDKRWAAMTRYLEYITQANPNGLWVNRRNNNFGDWLSLNADTDKDVLATAYYAYDAHLMAQMARALHQPAEAASYDALRARIQTAFNAAYVAPDGRIKSDTQTVYLLALHFGLLPENLRAAASQHLADAIAAKDNHLSTGFVGVGYLCPTLTASGRNDIAYTLLLNDTFPSWGYSIRQGATTLWERWDGYTAGQGIHDPGMNSFNHYSFGSVGEWLYREVAGIDTAPDAPGFARIVIAPHPGPGLTSAHATFDSVHGQIASAWQMQGGTLTLNVTIPANTTATVFVPAGNGPVTEGGLPAANAPGVRFLRREANAMVYAVGSGQYRFQAPAMAQSRMTFIHRSLRHGGPVIYLWGGSAALPFRRQDIEATCFRY